MMTVLYLAFGTNQAVHQQVTFSALSVLAKEDSGTKIVVFTDVPHYYSLLEELVEVRPIDAQTFVQWKGKEDFFFRVKIKALQELLKDTDRRHLLYLDGDTFCFAAPAKLIDLMEGGYHLMHAREGKLSALPTKTEQRMWKMCNGRIFGGVKVDDESTMYNAGVVGLHRAQANEVAACALAVCDDMLAAGVPQRLVEQLSFSLALAHLGKLSAANHTIGHYWGNKAEWNESIRTFLILQFLQSAPIERSLEAMAAFDFNSLPVYRKSSGTHRKLSRWVDKYFTKNKQAYIPTGNDPISDLSDR